MHWKLSATCLIAAAGFYALPLRPQGGATPGASAPNTYTGPVFEDVSQRSGLTVPNISSPDKRYVIESMSGGVGLFDCDNDGKLDIVTINSSTVERYREGGDPMVTLYHQEPDGTFKEITKQAGLARRGWGMGVAVADFDNDGWLDLYVTGYGRNVLYRNLGGCKFEDVTEKAGVGGGGFSTGAAWADYDRDGYVDLFVARYVHVDVNNLPEFGRDKFCRYRGVLVQCGPWGLPGEGDLLYHNRGDGTFEEVAEKAGVDDKEKRYGLGVVWGDYDNDGWPDLFVANDAGSNYLYHNNHNGTFKDVALLSGVALSGTGMPQGNMGVDFGDYNHDGWFDIIDTTFADQPKTLYRNLGPAGFEDVSSAAQIAQISLPDVAWGTGLVDFDNDGWPDIFIANGHVYPQVDAAATGGARYKEPIFLHLNKHDGTFEEISSASGLASLPLASRRGVAFGDLWNAGVIDVLILDVGEPPTLLRNRLANGNHWVEFKLQGTKSNRAAIGTRLTIHSGQLSQFNEVRGGGSYLSQNDLRLHFGLGLNAKIDSVDISWPSGLVEHLGNLTADRIYTIEEGKGIVPASSAPSTDR